MHNYCCWKASCLINDYFGDQKGCGAKEKKLFSVNWIELVEDHVLWQE
jgi:hypothetical protein